MEVCLIEVPFHAGDDRHAASRGPQRLLSAGAEGLFASREVDVSVERAGRCGGFRDTASASADVNRQLAAVVRRSLDDRRLPIVLSGSCNSCLGVLAGFDHTACGAVWLDAHADFNTPESTTSGFLPGMSAAIAVGHCYRSYWAQIGDNTPLAEEAIAMFGIRDLSPPAERERLERSAVQVVEWCDGQPKRDVLPVLDELGRRVREIYLHVDLDAFAPEIAPGVADQPAHGGLSAEQAEMIIAATSDRFQIRAVTIATYTPEADQNLSTLQLALSILDLLAQHAANQATRGSRHG